MYDSNSGMALDAAQCYDGWANNFGFTLGYYGGGTPPFETTFTPFNSFINLKTAIVVRKDSLQEQIQDVQEIITMMQEAAQ